MRIGLSFREPLVGESVACLLRSRRGWSIEFVALSVREALAAAKANPVSMLLVDTRGLKGAEIAILVGLREADGPMVVLLAGEADLERYLDLPVDRVLSRRAPTDDVFVALDELSRLIGRPRANPSPFDLSRREMECAQLVARGMSNRRIAELTGLREQSVKNVVSLAMRKLSVENRVQVALRLSQSASVEGETAEDLPTQAVVSLPSPEGVGA